jgi:beta-lactam-binding protein with PASTA domain
LQQQGFEVALPIARTYNPKYDSGIVFEQIPLANGKAPKGSKVTITVSQGAEMVPVPYVVDKKKADAISSLQQAGFKVTPKDQPSPTVEKGVVVDQKPAGGQTAPKGSEIVIYVSSGPEMVTVPDVSSMTVKDAKAKLVSLGFVPDVITPGATDLSTITDQLPTANTKAVKGSTVTLQASLGP